MTTMLLLGFAFGTLFGIGVAIFIWKVEDHRERHRVGDIDFTRPRLGDRRNYASEAEIRAVEREAQDA